MIGGGGVSQTSNTFSSPCNAKRRSPPMEKSQMAPPLLHRNVDVITWSGPLNTEMASPVDANSRPPCAASFGLLRDLHRTPPEEAAFFRRSRKPRSSYWLTRHTDLPSSVATTSTACLSSSDAGVPTSDHDQTTLLSRKSSRLTKDESVRGNIVATMSVLPLEPVGFAERAPGRLVEETRLLPGVAVPHGDAVLVDPSLAAGEDVASSVEGQSGCGEGPGLAIVRDAEAVARLAGERGEGRHATVVVAASRTLPRGEEERGRVEVGRVVDGRVGGVVHGAALLEHPVVDAHDAGGAAVGDAAAAVGSGADGDAVAGRAAVDGGGEAEAVGVEAAEAGGADAVEEAVVERLAVEGGFREARGHVEVARAEEVEEHREAGRVAVDEVLGWGRVVVDAGVPGGVDHGAEHGVTSGGGERGGRRLEHAPADVEPHAAAGGGGGGGVHGRPVTKQEGLRFGQHRRLDQTGCAREARPFLLGAYYWPIRWSGGSRI
nr:unnamed protein product [Digitaria exilis]